MSASRMPTRSPACAVATARLTAVVDLPTPPLPDATATIAPTPDGSAPDVGGRPDVDAAEEDVDALALGRYAIAHCPPKPPSAADRAPIAPIHRVTELAAACNPTRAVDPAEANIKCLLCVRARLAPSLWACRLGLSL